MTRTRRGKLPPPKSIDSDSEGAASGCSDPDKEEKPKKRARKSRSTRDDKGVESDRGDTSSLGTIRKPAHKRLAGRLAMMMSMPIDIFCVIAHYLGPDDLLRLSRSSKALRELLVSKSSRMAWRAAEEAAGLPKCPSDLSSPQYAAFIFDTFCMHCLDARAYKRIFSLRVRLCKNCTTKLVISGEQILQSGGLPEKYSENPVIFMLVPTMDYSLVFQQSDLRESHDISEFRHFTYYEPHFMAICEKYSAFEEASAAQKEFVDERRKMVCQIWPGLQEIESWIMKARQTRTVDNNNAIKSRMNSIRSKLIELNYTNDDFSTRLDVEGWKWDTLIKQPRALTDRIWNNIRPQLEETIRLRREKSAQIEKERRMRERQNKLMEFARTFMSSDEGKTCCVIASDLLVQPSIQEMIDTDEADTDIPQRHFDTLKQCILELSESRTRRVTEETVSSLMHARLKLGLQHIFASDSPEDITSGTIKQGHVENIAILQHPTSFFRMPNQPDYRNCYPGEALCTFPALVNKLRRTCLDHFDSETAFNDICSKTPLKAVPDRDAFSIAEELYASIGATSTLDGLEALGERFVCMRCSPTTRKLLSWVALVEHFFVEFKEFEGREQNRQRKKLGNKIINIHTHDEKGPGALTEVVYNPLQVKNKLIRKFNCKCDNCYQSKRSRVHITRSKSCRDCDALDWDGMFWCQKELDEHILAKHTLPKK